MTSGEHRAASIQLCNVPPGNDVAGGVALHREAARPRLLFKPPTTRHVRRSPRITAVASGADVETDRQQGLPRGLKPLFDGGGHLQGRQLLREDFAPPVAAALTRCSMSRRIAELGSG